MDDAVGHREALLETCRELVKAPDEFAELRIEADLLVSQAGFAKTGASAAARAAALRPFIERLKKKDELALRLEIISFNLDDLPDVGESIQLRQRSSHFAARPSPNIPTPPICGSFATA